MPRALTGIRASGNVHIGNYLGAIRPACALQKTHECLLFIADMHSLTTNKDPRLIQQYTLDVVACWVASSGDERNFFIYRQSDLPICAEMSWYLSCTTGVGLLEKAHAYKDSLAQNREINHGVFAYPVLMAADIVLYDADVVPVGKDQKQHVEMARDMAGSFNAVYGDGILKLPQPLIYENVMTVPGLDGRKMSKSYNNELPLFCSEKELRKKIMSIVTDSTPVEEPKCLKGSLLEAFFEAFASKDEKKSVEEKLTAGNYGWGHAKQDLFEITNTLVKEPREKYNELRKDEKQLLNILDEGAQAAFAIGLPVLERVREAVGMRKFPFRRV